MKMENIWDIEYDIPKEVIPLEGSARSVLPKSTVSTGIDAIRLQQTPWAPKPNIQIQVAEIREKYAAIIGATPSSIGVFYSTSSAMSLAAHNVTKMGLLSPGKKILFLENDMSSAVLCWQNACKITGAAFCVVQNPVFASEHRWTEKIIESITPDVAVVCLPTVHWCDGSLINLEAVTLKIESFPLNSRPLLIIDGTQSIGAMEFDVSKIRPSFVACSVQKWLISPYGMSLAYCNPELIALWEPLDIHEGARAGSVNPEWDSVGVMTNDGYPEEIVADMRKLDCGGRMNPATVKMTNNSLGLVCSWSPSLIQETLRSLTDLLVDELQMTNAGKAFYIKPRDERCGHILGLRLSEEYKAKYPQLTLPGIAEKLKAQNAFVSLRGGCLRISPYVYITTSKILRFVTLLSEAVLEIVSSKSNSRHRIVRHRFENHDDDAEEMNDFYSEADPAISGDLPQFNVLITGVAGWLGQFVWGALTSNPTLLGGGSRVSLWGAYHATAPSGEWISPSQCVTLDLESTESIRETITKTLPDVIIHLAAMSSPFQCHQNPDKALAVNCPSKLLTVLQELVPSCVVVFSSTDLVYDGEKPPYCVDAENPPQPTTIYGKHKLQFENELISRLPTQSVVLRLSNMIGNNYKFQPAGVKFLQFLKDSLDKRENIGLREDEVRSFVYVSDVVKVIADIVVASFESKQGGRHGSLLQSIVGRCFNVGGPVGLSRLQLAKLLADSVSIRMDCGDTEAKDSGDEDVWGVHRISSSSAAAAPGIGNPRDVSMNSAVTEETFCMKFTAQDEAIRRIIAE